MHCHPLKIALAVILGLSALSLLPTLHAPGLNEMIGTPELWSPDEPAPPPVPSATQVDSPARDVGMVACRVSTGEYAGFVDSSTFDGTRWVYTLVLPSMSTGAYTVETIKAGQAEQDQPESKSQSVNRGVPASDYFVTRFQCPDGQPAPKKADIERRNSDRIIRCTPALPLTRKTSTGVYAPFPCPPPLAAWRPAH